MSKTVLAIMVEGALETAERQAHYDFIHTPTPDNLRDAAFRHAEHEIFGPGGIAHEISLHGEDVVLIRKSLAVAYFDEYRKLQRGEIPPVDPSQ